MSALIEARGLSKRYGKTRALDDVSFDVAPGRIVGLIGPNGAGKTTLMKATLGLMSYDGELRVLGLDPYRQRAALMKHVCFIADVAVLPTWLKVRHALELMRGVHPKFVESKAREFLSQTRIDINSRVKSLSKGMIVQLHLALVMAIDVRLLVLDEPTLGLDILYRKRFYESLLNDYFDEQRTILVSTHQVEEIENILTDLMFIQDGRIVLNESMDDIATRFVEVLVRPELSEQVRALGALHERQIFGKNLFLFEGLERQRLKEFGELHTPSVADLFVAKLQGGGGMNFYLQLVRREFWEHRAFVIVPLVLAALMLIAMLYTLFSGVSNQEAIDHVLEAIDRDVASKMTVVLFMVYAVFNAEVGIVLTAVGAFYLLDCLYADRKDRSVLFWKSLPVSDTEAVLAKLLTALVILPLLAILTATVIYILSLGVLSIFVLSVGGSPWSLIWAPAPWLTGPAWILLLVFSAVLWFAPFAAWLLFCSAWARSLPILWAVLTPAAIAFGERLLLGSERFLWLIGDRFEHFAELLPHPGDLPAGVAMGAADPELPGWSEAARLVTGLLASPGLWLGLVVSAALVTGSIWLRRARAEI